MDELLLNAVCQNDINEVKKLLEQGANPCAQGHKIFHTAIEKEVNSQIIELFILHGANVHVKDNYAWAYCLENVVQESAIVLFKHGAKITDNDVDSIITNDMNKLMQEMIKTDCRFHISFERQKLAITSYSYEIIDVFIHLNVFDLSRAYDIFQLTLKNLRESNCMPIVKHLTKNMDMIDNKYLQLAANYGRSKIVEYLLPSTDLSQIKISTSFLKMIIDEQNIEMAELFLKKCHIEISSISNHSEEFIDFIIENYRQIDQPLIDSILASNNIDYIRTLLKHKKDFTVKNETVLKYFKLKEYDIILLLIDNIDFTYNGIREIIMYEKLIQIVSIGNIRL